MRRTRSLALAIGLAAAAFVSLPRAARAQEDSAAMAANRGFQLGIGPTLLLPMREGGPYGGGLTLEGRYGIKAGPTVLAPGARFAGYFISRRFIGVAMPTFRVTVPVGPLAPFLLGGIGPGYISNEGEAGVALMGGGGLMVHFGRVLAIGAELSYQTITGTEFKSLTIGPAITFFGG